MIWPMEILKIYIEEQPLIKYCVIILLKIQIMKDIQNMIDIKVVWLQWFIYFLIKRLQVVLLKTKLC